MNIKATDVLPQLMSQLITVFRHMARKEMWMSDSVSGVWIYKFSLIQVLKKANKPKTIFK